MPVETLNPDGLFKPGTFSQVSIARGTRTVYLSGQVALDAQGALVAAERIGFDPKRPITLLGVAALSSPDFLIEVEAVAVLA